MTIVAYTALHYGSPYLGAAIRSIIDDVDRYYVFYSANGSHGTPGNSGIAASESRRNLFNIAQVAAGDKLNWVDGNWQHEGQQRDTIFAM